MHTGCTFYAKKNAVDNIQELFLYFQRELNKYSVGLLTTFPAGVSHSPLFTTPKEPSPSFSNSVRSFSGMRQVRACCCPSRGAPPPGCVVRTPSPRPSGGVGDSLRKEEAGWPCWGKSPPSGRLPLNTWRGREEEKERMKLAVQ